jgi:ATP-dependent helicase Lhr and Lhr-like helicase
MVAGHYRAADRRKRRRSPERNGCRANNPTTEETGATFGRTRSHALALQLLNRYGVLLRESVAAENVPGGFSAVYDVLKAL